MNKSRARDSKQPVWLDQHPVPGLLVRMTCYFIPSTSGGGAISTSLPSREHIERTLLAVPSLEVLPTGDEVIDLMTEIRKRGCVQMNCPFLPSIDGFCFQIAFL